MSLRSPSTLPLVLALLVPLALACGGGASTTGTAVTSVAAVPASATPAATQDVPRILKVTGTLLAVDDADVAAEAAGAVSRIVADRGELVAKGAALLELDTAVSSLQAREAAASVAAAEVQVKQAQADCDRARTLTDAGGLSTAERDRLLAQCEQGARQLDAAKARKALADTALARATVRAPFAGVVAERMVSPGDYVTPGRAVVKLVALDPLRLELSVPERAAPLVLQNAKVRFEVTERPGEMFEAVVTRISPALRERTRDLVIEATVANGEGKLRPNSFVLARVELPAAPAVTVPVASLVSRGENSHVFVVVNGVAEERVVELGERIGDAVEIRAGVTAGESVVTPVPQGVSDGVPLAGL